MYMGALVAAAQLVLAHCVTFVAHAPPPPEKPYPVAKSKIELKPLEIKCELTDFIIISAPVTKANETRYILYRPNGQSRGLNISRVNILKHPYQSVDISNYFDEIKVKFAKGLSPIITPEPQCEVFNANNGQQNDSTDIFGENRAGMKENDFMLGPLDYEDYGNWVLSLYLRENQSEWIEAFQVITVQIIEIIPARPDYGIVRIGEDFSLQFAYPLEDIETCELKVPIGSIDRFYNTNGIDRKYCGYVVRNVTQRDIGLWTIVGVGRITYEATVLLMLKSSDDDQLSIYAEEVNCWTKVSPNDFHKGRSCAARILRLPATFTPSRRSTEWEFKIS